MQKKRYRIRANRLVVTLFTFSKVSGALHVYHVEREELPWWSVFASRQMFLVMFFILNVSRHLSSFGYKVIFGL